MYEMRLHSVVVNIFAGECVGVCLGLCWVDGCVWVLGVCGFILGGWVCVWVWVCVCRCVWGWDDVDECVGVCVWVCVCLVDGCVCVLYVCR